MEGVALEGEFGTSVSCMPSLSKIWRSQRTCVLVMEAQGIQGGDAVNIVHNMEREIIVISDSSRDSTSEAHSNVECATRENPDSAGGFAGRSKESVRSICEAIQYLRLALAETLERIQLEIEFLEEHGMLKAVVLRPPLTFAEGCYSVNS